MSRPASRIARRLAVLLPLAALSCRTAPPPAPAAPVAPAPEAPPPEPGAGIDVSSLDRAVRPCDDFYQFACGGWMACTPLPADKARWTRSFDEMRERNRWKLRAILEEEAAGRADPRDRYAGLTGDLYAACMDEAAVEARGLADLQAEWARVDGVKDARTLGAEVAEIHAAGNGVLFRFGQMQDRKDATQVIGALYQGGLSLPDRDYYLDADPRKAATRADYRLHVEKMLRLAGRSAGEAAADAGAVVRIETRLAESHFRRADMRDPRRTYNRLDRAGLEAAAPLFPWDGYARALGLGRLTAVSVSTPPMAARLEELLSTTPAEAWRAYLRWHLLDHAARDRALPRAFVEEDFAFRSKNFTGQRALEPRWKHCVSTVDDLLGEALGQAFVRRHFAGEAKTRALELVAGVEKAMGSRLSGLPWLDGATRARAEEKLARIGNKIGYPDAWRSYDGLSLPRGSYPRALAAARAFEVRRELAKISKPVDRTEWGMTPPTVNAYWSGSLVEMVFPAGILQPPFWSPASPDAVNYGAVGVVVGHELTHGFDDQGRKLDAAGNMTDWWSPEVAGEFEKRAACVDRQYAAYQAEGDVKLNGKLTLGENLSDLGGVKLSFAAWRASRAGKPPEPEAGGFTPAQQFFLSFAQVWCEVASPENRRLRAQTDPHSPGRWRVNGPLANLPEFAEAFACKAGDPMVRVERCAVW